MTNPAVVTPSPAPMPIDRTQHNVARPVRENGAPDRRTLQRCSTFHKMGICGLFALGSFIAAVTIGSSSLPDSSKNVVQTVGMSCAILGCVAATMVCQSAADNLEQLQPLMDRGTDVLNILTR